MDVGQLIALVSLILTIISSAIVITWKVSSIAGKLGGAITGLTSEVAGLKNMINLHREDFLRENNELKDRVGRIEQHHMRVRS